MNTAPPCQVATFPMNVVRLSDTLDSNAEMAPPEVELPFRRTKLLMIKEAFDTKNSPAVPLPFMVAFEPTPVTFNTVPPVTTTVWSTVMLPIHTTSKTPPEQFTASTRSLACKEVSTTQCCLFWEGQGVKAGAQSRHP